MTIELTSGIYRLTQPLALTPEDSGRNGHNLIFRARAGAHPVVSGGVQISGWKKVDSVRNIWGSPNSFNRVKPHRVSFMWMGYARLARVADCPWM